MIISRKRFEAEIEKAKRETEERCWMLTERERFRDDVCRRFERIESQQAATPLEAVVDPFPEKRNIIDPVSFVDKAVDLTAGILKKLIDSKEKFGLSDDDKEVIEAKELLQKVEGARHE